MSYELSILNNGALLEKVAERSVLECNYISQAYGLALTQGEAKELVAVANSAVRKTGRIELGGGILNKLIAAFCESSYLTPENYAEALCELAELFYEMKNEFPADVSDDELIKMMYDTFEKYSGGSIESLAENYLLGMAKNMRAGKPADYVEPVQLDSDEKYEYEKRKAQRAGDDK